MPNPGNGVVESKFNMREIAVKRLAVLLLVLPFCAFAERFVLNQRNNTTVDVLAQGEMLNVACRFPAHTKFDKAVNAQLDDQKSRWVLVEGLIRYFKAGTNETMEVSGRQVLDVKKDGDYLSYTFSVPQSGCTVVPKPSAATNTTSRTTVLTLPQSLNMTNRPTAVVALSCMTNQTAAVRPMPALSMPNPVAMVKPLPMLKMANPVAAVKSMPEAGLTNQAANLNHFTNTTIKTTNGGK